jgi:RimJ/RimL family protein N-acetyltransferase
MKISYVPHAREVIADRVIWLNDRDVNRWFDDYQNGTTIEAQTAWFDKYEQDESRDFLTILADSQPIGVVGLTHIDLKNQQAELFIMIGDANYRGRGIGRQAVEQIIRHAFQGLKLHRVCLHVSALNELAIRCYRAAGFEEEGRLCDDRLTRGQFQDTLIMARLSDIIEKSSKQDA